MTNLQILFEKNRDMSHEDRQAFDDYFIGALSILVNKDLWESALSTAQRMMANRPKAVQS